MPTMTIYPSSHTFVSNMAKTADYTGATTPRTCYWFANATSSESKWQTAGSNNLYCEATILRFQRPNALKYSRILSTTLHWVLDGYMYVNSREDVNISRFSVATYTTSNALSAVAWNNFRTGGVLGDWISGGTTSTPYINTPYSRDLSITSLYNGDLSASEFTLVIAAGSPYTNVGTQYENKSYIDTSSCYLTVTYEEGTQPAPTPLYPKDITLIESESTLFSWQFNSDTEAVQTAAELQYKNVNDENYTTVSLTQSGYSYLLNQTLPVGSYQWRVKVTNDAGTSSTYSDVAYFNVIGKPASPIINEPENKTLTRISWNTTNQQSCEIILTDQTGKELYHETLATNETFYDPDFFLSGQYMFSVRVMNASMMWSDWTQRAFTISAAGPTAATASLANVAGDPAVTISYTLPEGISAVLMRSQGGVEKVIAHLSQLDTKYRDDTVAANVAYSYWIRTYDEGYTDTAHINTSISFEGAILNGTDASLNLKTSDEKFLPHSEDISRDYALLSLSGREYPMIERGEFTKVEFSRRFQVSGTQKKVLDALSKEESLFYRDTKENAFRAALKRVHYDEYMDNGYIATLEMIRLNDEEVLLNV